LADIKSFKERVGADPRRADGGAGRPLRTRGVQRFKELGKGKTAVLISHRFSSVRMADRILVLAGGAVEAQGTHEEPLARPGRYAELFELQAAGYR
jgi:ABC-type multidrug transport system ATPase subunit